MSRDYNNGMNSSDLDNWITGHHGEDQFEDAIEEANCCECGKELNEEELDCLNDDPDGDVYTVRCRSCEEEDLK